MKKRMLSMLLAIVMVVGLVPGFAVTASAAETSGTTGDCTWTFDDTTGMLTISGSGAMADYTSSGGQPWGDYKTSITKVVIEKGVTNIGTYAFAGCSNLTTVSIGATVTTIGNNAFSNSTSKITTIEYWGTKNPGNNSSAFFGAMAFFVKVPTNYEDSACCGMMVKKELEPDLPEYMITVSADPTEGGTVTGGGKYKESVTVEATAADGYSFAGWFENDEKVSASALYTFTAAADRTLVAKFEATTPGWTYPTSEPTPTWAGDGTESNPFVITAAQQLADLAWFVNNNKPAYNAAHYLLGNDIDLAGRSWTTIGYYDSSNVSDQRGFKGAFDGNGKTVSGLNSLTDDHKAMSLFGYVQGGSVKDLTVSGSFTSTTAYTAGICARATDSVLDNCTNQVNITIAYDTGMFYAGGVVATASGTTEVKNCRNEGTLTYNGSAESYIGGICGGLVNSNAKITGCTNVAAVTNNSSTSIPYTGGICGYSADSALISGCNNSGTIQGVSYVGGIAGAGRGKAEDNINSGTVTGTGEYIGGIYGCNHNTGEITGCANTGNITGATKVGGISGFGEGEISESYNTGTIKGTSQQSNICVGGIEGYTNTKSVVNCYNLGQVSGYNSSSQYVGGISGRLCDGARIENCYSYGTVTNAKTGNLNNILYYSGAIFGGSGTVTNSYYLNGTDGKAIQKTAEQFANGSVYSLLQRANTTQVWGQTIGTDNYPVFYNGSNMPNLPHEHSYKYEVSSDDATITAICEGTTGICSAPNMELTISKPAHETYGDGKIASATLSGTKIGDIDVSDTDIVYTKGNETLTAAPTDAGTYKASIAITVGGTNYPAYVEYTIAKADPAYNSPTGNTYIYDGSEKELVNVSGSVIGGTMYFKIGDGEWSTDIPKASAVGTYTILWKITGDTNYNDVAESSVTAKINKQSITPSVNLEGWTYGEDAKTPGVTGNTGNGEVTYTYYTDEACTTKTSETDGAAAAGGVPKNAGTYFVKVVIAETENYAGAEATAKFTIAKKAVTAIVSVESKTYDRSNTATVSASVSESDLVSGDSIAISCLTGTFNSVNVGDNISVAVDSSAARITGADNYTVTIPATATGSITAKPLSEVTLTLSPYTFVYDGSEQEVTSITASFGDVTLVQDTDYTIETSSVTKATDVSTGNGYAVTINAVDGSNYSGSQTAYWTITKGGFTAAVAMGSYAYNGTLSVPSVSNNPESGTVTYYYNTTNSNSGGTEWKNMTATSLDAGIYYMYAVIGETASYQSYTTEAVSFTVSNGTQIAPAPTGSYAISSTDATKFIYTIDVVENAQYKMDDGSWQDSNVFDGIVPKSQHTFYVKLKENTNYNESPASDGTQVTFTKLANTTSPALAYTVSGDANARVITITEVENAEYSFDGGSTWQASNVKTGIDGTNDATKKVNITIRYEETAVYHPSTPAQTVEVDVTKEAQTVTFDTTDRTATYGNGTLEARTATAAGAITYSSSDESVAAVDADGVVTVLKAGEATITASAAETAGYAAASASYKLTVAPKALTITVADKSAYVGNQKPDLSSAKAGTDYTVSGLVDGDSITVALSYATEPDMSKAGEHEITATAADSNYTITVVKGKLTVSYRPSSGSSSNTTSKTEKNEDGSTTTTTTNKTTGTVTETTKYPDGSTTTVETKKDGSTTETSKTSGGTTGTVVTDKTGTVTKVSAKVPASAAKDAEQSGEAVKLPVEVEAADDTNKAVEIEVDVPNGGVTVEIPVEDVTSGTVVVIVNKDGTEEIVKTSTVTESGVVVALDKDATIKVIDNSKHFVDVHPVDHWAEEAVDFVVARTIYSGTSATTFHPDNPMTRGMLAVVLHNLEDNPDHAFDGVFHDVAEGSWYEDAIHWAADEGIVGGYGNGNYGPNDNITREQLAVMLWRYAGSPDSDHSLDHFTDAHLISDYAETALAWANENGIINGKGGGILDPKGDATRAQVAQMLMNYLKTVL